MPFSRQSVVIKQVSNLLSPSHCQMSPLLRPLAESRYEFSEERDDLPPHSRSRSKVRHIVFQASAGFRAAGQLPGLIFTELRIVVATRCCVRLLCDVVRSR